MFKSFRQIIDSYPGGRAQLASDLSTSTDNVKGMYRRNSIPNRFWRALIVSSKQRDMPGVTADLLVQMAAEPERIRGRQKTAPPVQGIM